jgi:hypothetical protein
MIPKLTRNYNAAAAIGANLIVKSGATDSEVLPAAASTEDIIGASTGIDVAQGESCDVIHGGIADIKLGGNVTRGKLVTSDASGCGVQAAPAAGVNARVAGIALASGVSGDIIPVLLNPAQIQGA